MTAEAAAIRLITFWQATPRKKPLGRHSGPTWQAALDVAPKLEYFKMSEAESLKGQFSDFSPEQRTKRVNQFIDVIQAHNLQEASVAVSAQAYQNIFWRCAGIRQPTRSGSFSEKGSLASLRG
jgi:hypothetical protein